jgi:hypothetical protein
MRYILKHQIIRLLVLAAMVGYTTLQLRRMKDMVQLDWYLVFAIIVLGLLAIVVTTAKIRIASAHRKHHQMEGNKHHGTTDS